MEVSILKLDNFARGIGYLNGKIIFIENALPNEVVEVSITKETKKYYEGKVVKYIKKSPSRINPICPYYDKCGGCNLLHLSIEEEKKFKEEKVKSILKKLSNIDIDIMPIEERKSLSYRNKITLHGNNKRLGFYEKNTNKLIEIDKCLLSSPSINSLIKSLKELGSQEDIEEVMIRSSNNDKEVLVKLTGNISNYSSIIPLVDALIINDKVITNKYIKTNISSKKYFLSANSFFQVNRYLTEYLYNEVLNVVKDSNLESVLDLYCGTGSITLYISDYVRKIDGIDYLISNIEDANRNKILNNSKNANFICAKVEDVIDNYKDIDLIIVDPPRSGLKRKTIDTIKRIKPKKIVYISCDVVTLGRDLKLLLEEYNINMIKPFNMFPRTYHVECISIMSLKEKI